ncbi:endogenous retrovirus group K member 8 Gag polyprotein-like [Heliangelus exortis]|uniref:endogenous retrovirus group K member 8 Gag polyprotein-like n=1 Tax=Heliangelus exortis TaxID=472823 RepID=UPI003A92C2BF
MPAVTPSAPPFEGEEPERAPAVTPSAPPSEGEEPERAPAVTPLAPPLEEGKNEQVTWAVQLIEKRDVKHRPAFQQYRNPPTLTDDEDDVPTPPRQLQNARGATTGRPGRWSGIIRDAILEGEWEPTTVACPVLQGANGQPVFEQHSWKTLQQARQIIKEQGLRSESGRAILDWLFTSDVNSPYDCRSLTQYLLTPSQQIIWLREWECLAAAEVNRAKAPGDPLAGVTAEMLTGSRRFAEIDLQLEYPRELHHAAARLARQAFYAVPEPHPVPSFTNVKQGLNEPYQNFVDRLWQSVTAQSDLTIEQRESMFKLLAFENANPRSKALFSTLPKTAPVSEMLDVAARASQHQQHQEMAGAFAAALEPTHQLLAAVVQKLGNNGGRGGQNRRNRPNRQRQSSPVCSRCHARGHTWRNCSAVVWCNRCQQATHNDAACWYQKNGRDSARGPRAGIQVAGPTLYAGSPPQQPGEASASIYNLR